MVDSSIILFGIGGLVVCIIVTVFLLLVYSGLFRSVEVGAGRPPIADVVLAYKFIRGPYKEAGPYFTDTAKLAPDNKALAIYYDDPNAVPAHRLRYVVASILAEGGAPVLEEMKKSFLDEGYKIYHLPMVTNVVKTTFPYISLLSVFIAISKVYPKLARYIQDHKLCAHPCIEIYDGQTIHFMAPLAKQDEFYVPEYSQPDRDSVESTTDAHSLQDDSISYSEPSSSDSGRSVSSELTGSTNDTQGETIKMSAVDSGAGEAKILTDSGFASSASPSLIGSLASTDSKVDDKVDTASESSSGSPFEDIKTDDLIKELTEQETVTKE